MVCRQVYNSICGLQMSTTVFVVFNSVYGLQASLQQYLWSSGICGLQTSLQQYLWSADRSTIGSVAKSHQRQGLQASLGTSALCSHSRCQPNPPAQSVSQTHQHSQLAKPTSTVSQRTVNYDKSDFHNFDLQATFRILTPPPPPHGYTQRV